MPRNLHDDCGAMQSKSKHDTVSPLPAAMLPYSTCRRRPSELKVVMVLSYSVGFSRLPAGRAAAVGRRRERADLASCELASSNVIHKMNLLGAMMVIRNDMVARERAHLDGHASMRHASEHACEKYEIESKDVRTSSYRTPAPPICCCCAARAATPSFEKHCYMYRRAPQRAGANLATMRSLLPLSGGPARSQLPWHGRSVSSWCRIGTSFVLTYASFSSFVMHRHYRKIDGIAFPITDDALIQMANDDLSVWLDNARPTNASTSKGRANPTYHIPGPDELRRICPKYECTVVHIDTRPSPKREQSELVRFVNRDFDHLRLLWYGCSLNRAASKLQREGVEINGYFVINVGDEYIEEGRVDFPVWSKGSPVEGGAAKKTLDVMMPYEELLWSYPAGDLNAVPFTKKKATAVYRGGCTHPRRAEMVDAVIKAFPPPASDVAVSCRPNFTSLSPKEQGKYRCLLDYDGNGYSRRMAWYLQTGGVVMRGGDIDDVLSRIARSDNHDSRSKEAPPVIFWNWTDEEDGNGTSNESTNEEWSNNAGLIFNVRKCLSDDVHAQEVSTSALKFWSKYVKEGQPVWDGFMAHLIVEQSRRLTLTLNEDEFNGPPPTFGGPLGWTQRHTVGEPLFQSLSQSDLVCSVVFDAVTPTGQRGQPQWPYITTCIIICLSTLAISFSLVTPTFGVLLRKSIKKTISLAAGGSDGNKKDASIKGIVVRVVSQLGLARKTT